MFFPTPTRLCFLPLPPCPCLLHGGRLGWCPCICSSFNRLRAEPSSQGKALGKSAIAVSMPLNDKIASLMLFWEGLVCQRRRNGKEQVPVRRFCLCVLVVSFQVDRVLGSWTTKQRMPGSRLGTAGAQGLIGGTGWEGSGDTELVHPTLQRLSGKLESSMLRLCRQYLSIFPGGLTPSLLPLKPPCMALFSFDLGCPTCCSHKGDPWESTWYRDPP